jgi:catechol 2,3-dioxygenase-like lactoylglutathione lyase family enzyme
MPGIHHVTAISGKPTRNLDFYTRILRLRFVKKTVNFDDPGTYHLYHGDEVDHPGTILTFFPWEHAVPRAGRTFRLLMEWSGRAPASPASDAGIGRVSNGAPPCPTNQS